MLKIPDKTNDLDIAADPRAWRVSVIIPAYNEESVLAACLKSILDQKQDTRGGVCEIIVADNRSTDSTCTVARSFGARIVSVDPGYPGRARNAGARHAEGDILAFVDADCVLPPDWLACSLEHFGDSRIVASAVPQAPPLDSSTWVPRAWFQLTRPSKQVAKVKWLPAFNLLVRRECFIQANGFDESLRTCEDSDLSFRLAHYGQMIIDGRTAAAHLGESATLSQFFRREMWRSAGNFKSASQRGALRDELISLVLPPAYLFALVAGLFLLVAGLLFSRSAMVLGAVVAGIAVFGPLGIALSRNISLWRLPIALMQCWLLLSVYFVARALGMLIPAKRLERQP